jgi:hypothetical protein
MLSSLIEGQRNMKRFLASALIVGISTFGLVGCEEKSETKTTTESKTPTGSETVTTTTQDKKTGDMKDGGATPPPVVEPPK